MMSNGGFLNGGTPKSSKSLVLLPLKQTWWRLGIPHFMPSSHFHFWPGRRPAQNQLAGVGSLIHSILFRSIRFDSIPFHSIPSDSILFCSILFHSILFHSIYSYSSNCLFIYLSIYLSSYLSQDGDFLAENEAKPLDLRTSHHAFVFRSSYAQVEQKIQPVIIQVGPGGSQWTQTLAGIRDRTRLIGWTPKGIPWDSLGPLKSIWVPKLILVLDIWWYWRVAERSERNIVLGIFGHGN